MLKLNLIVVSFLFIYFTTVSNLPIVDKGVFVIVGVNTCRNGSGYCILGNECSVDKEFKADDSEGHCDGLKTAFTPRANFLCCMLQENETTTTAASTTTSTTPETPSAESVEIGSSSTSVENSGSNESSVEGTEIVISKPSTSAPTTLAPVTVKPIPESTVSTIYEQKTEINVEQSLTMEIVCGMTFGIGEGRVASQTPSTTSCFTAALVRSPTSLFSLSDPGSFLCTGAMISRDYLLTSATCVSRIIQQDLKLFKVLLGAKHIVHPSHGVSSADYRNIEEIRVHESYTVNGHMRYGDIALVKLEPKNGTSSYCSICLPDEKQDWSNIGCSVTGYSHPADSHESDGFLHEAPQHVESQSHCESTNIAPNSNLKGLLCASGEKSAEACFSPRDAGSPLSCNVDGVMKLAGVFSSGFHCGNKESPVLYTDVRDYLSWIKLIV